MTPLRPRRFGPVTFALTATALAVLFRLSLGSFGASESTLIVFRGVIFLTGIGVIARLFAQVQQHEAAERRLSALVESSDDAIVSSTLDGIIISWNPGAERLFGYAAGEVIGRSLTIIIPPDRIAEEDAILGRIRNDRRVEPFETVRRRKDGTLVDVSITVSPIKVDEEIVGASKIARDITERRRIDRLRNELLDRETMARDRLAFLADTGALLTSSLDYEETLDRAVHLALPRLGDFCAVLVQDEHGQLAQVATGHVSADKESLVRELTPRLMALAAPDGPSMSEQIMNSGRIVVRAVGRFEGGEALEPQAIAGVPLMVRGRPVGLMAFGTTRRSGGRDYDEADLLLIEEFARRVSLAVENARLFRQVEALNRLKDEFLATVSHELRTPLSAVLGWTRLLASGQLDADRVRHAIVTIERNAQAQAGLVDDILEIARGMSGTTRLESTDVDLAVVVQRSLDAIAPTASAKGVTLLSLPAERTIVVGDANRLQQIVWNLLSNAVKFTPAGGRVEVLLSRGDIDAIIRVSDTGAGIPSAFLPYVFDKFRQADASYTRQHGGLGLGLAIARNLVELHGGSIEAQSEGEGRGATFIVRLPLAVRVD